MRILLLTLTLFTLGLQAPKSPALASQISEGELADLYELYRRREFFELRDRLTELPAELLMVDAVGYLEAALHQAFNRPLASNETIDRLLATDPTPPQLALQLQGLRLTNALRLHRYREALDSARAVLSSPVLDKAPVLTSETRNKLALLEALADVPPQEATIDGPSRLALGNDKRVPLTINGKKFRFALDTGANFSVMMRSEAEQLGLEIRPADLVIATSTAKRVTGDVAVADRVDIGKISYRHVVFLILPDAYLTFANDQEIPGLIGFPVVEAMREVRFRRDNVMEVPVDPPRRSLGNLVLDDLDPLTPVRYRKDDLLCRLDTGAGQTVFYEPFFRRYRDRIEAVGHPVTTTAGGVGGIQEIPALRLQTMAFTLAAAGINLRRVDVYTVPIRPDNENYLFCNVGLDALGQYRSYTINFADMALVLR